MSGDIIEIIDQSVRDYEVSGDAMRWAPVGTVPAIPDPARDEFLREAICRWLAANGIDYKSVPLNSHCQILSGRKIYYEVYRRRDGKMYVDPVTGDAARGPAVARLKVHPDCVVSSWVWLDVDYPPSPCRRRPRLPSSLLGSQETPMTDLCVSLDLCVDYDRRSLGL